MGKHGQFAAIRRPVSARSGRATGARRRDTAQIVDTSQRPSNAEYDRYLWLVELLKAGHYDDAEAQRNAPMLVGDVFSSAIFAAANRALSQLGDWLGIAPDLGELDDWTRRFATAVQRQGITVTS